MNLWWVGFKFNWECPVKMDFYENKTKGKIIISMVRIADSGAG